MASEKLRALESATTVKYRPPLEKVLYKFRQDKSALVGAGGLLAIFALVIFVPIFSPYDPIEQSFSSLIAPPSLAHPMGTDDLGRDLLTRVMLGGRYSLIIGFGSILFASMFGTLFGSIAGYTRRQWLDDTLMRVMDVLISIPAIILGIGVLGILGTNPFDLGFWTLGNLQKIILVIGIVYTPRFARVTRGAVLQERDMDYVELAKLEGASKPSILFREIFPNILSPILVLFTYRTGSAMIIAAGLNYLGIGIQKPTPSWGSAISTGQEYILTGEWWMVVFPALLLALTIIFLNIVGDAIRDALDPAVSTREGA